MLRSTVAIAIAAVCTVAIAVSGQAQTAPRTPPPTGPRIVEQASGVTPLLQAVHAASSTVVWAAGHGGVVLRTTDGGATWERRLTPAGDSLEFRDVHAFGADSAWILSAGSGNKSRIYRTTNGGGSWDLQFINADTAAFYDCLSFGSPAEGIAYGDASHGGTNLLRTDDGGRSWRLLAPSAVPAPLPNEGAFAASGLCVGHGDARTVYVATGAPGARLFRSRDTGRTWDVENTPFTRGIAAGLTGLSFVDGTRGIVVAADINRLRTDTSRSVVGITPDGGRTWEMRSRPPLPGALAGVAWVPGVGPEVAVAAGYGGAFFTTDEARTWTTITDRVTTGVTASARTAWIVGGNGRIWRLDW